MAPKYISKLQGKRVLVLGGTSGIGFCVAEAAVEHGATVIISSSRQAKIDNTIQRLTSSYPEAKVSFLSDQHTDCFLHKYATLMSLSSCHGEKYCGPLQAVGEHVQSMFACTGT